MYVVCMYVYVALVVREGYIAIYKPCGLGYKLIAVVSGQASRHKFFGICKNQQLHF